VQNQIRYVYEILLTDYSAYVGDFYFDKDENGLVMELTRFCPREPRYVYSEEYFISY